ncbi:MAG TPA: YccF domain-containing protein [Beutenbergiaceae bacterium]|nr:YccF domain-containing protein [Beutenbergiaceae bacterium]
MRGILNFIWLVFAGFWLAVGYAIAGVLACLLVVTIPFGVASFRLAGYVLWPFGRDVVRVPHASGWSAIGNMVWFIIAGMWLALGHVLTAIPLALSVVGIPMAYANIKMVPLALTPFGRRVVERPRGLPGGY